MALLSFKRIENKGFSLIELSLVLIIVGMILSVGVGVMNSLTKKSKLTRERSNLSAIKNSLISYGLSQGNLPTPAPVTPIPGDPGLPPGDLPYLELKISSGQRDVWGLPYRYDVTNFLVNGYTNNPNPQNICAILYELNNLTNWTGATACTGNGILCVADDNDTQRYHIAAYMISRGEDNRLGAKNRTGNRIYEMSSNSYDATIGRDDIVAELSFSDLSTQLCNAQNTGIAVTITNEGFLNPTGTIPCEAGTGFPGGTTINISLGQNLYSGASCTNIVNFDDLAKCDAGLAIANCNGGTAFDGKVDWTL